MKRAGSAAIWLVVVLLAVIAAMIAGGLMLWKVPEYQDWYRLKEIETEYRPMAEEHFKMMVPGIDKPAWHDRQRSPAEEKKYMRCLELLIEREAILARRPDWVHIVPHIPTIDAMNKASREIQKIRYERDRKLELMRREREEIEFILKSHHRAELPEPHSLKWVLEQVHAAHIKEESISRKDIPYRILALDTDVKRFMQKCLDSASSNSVVPDEGLKRLYTTKHDTWAIALKCIYLHKDQRYRVLLEEIWGRCPELRNEQAIKSVTERWADLLLGKPSLADEVWRAIMKRVPPERYSDSLRIAVVGLTSPQIIENLNPVP